MTPIVLIWRSSESFFELLLELQVWRLSQQLGFHLICVCLLFTFMLYSPLLVELADFAVRIIFFIVLQLLTKICEKYDLILWATGNTKHKQKIKTKQYDRLARLLKINLYILDAYLVGQQMYSRIFLPRVNCNQICPSLTLPLGYK